MVSCIDKYLYAENKDLGRKTDGKTYLLLVSFKKKNADIFEENTNYVDNNCIPI